jgi:hypothetical protein
VCITLAIAAQTVNFRNISLDEACSIAKKENKIVMLVLESPSCNQCNEVAKQGLSGSVIKRFTDNNCVIIKAGQLPSQLASGSNLFQLGTVAFGVIYLDGDMNILNIQNTSSSNYSSYLDHIEKALSEKDNNENGIIALKRNYYNNINDFTSVVKLIQKIQQMKLELSEILLDDLVQKAPQDSAESISFIQFILECAPTINSLALRYSYKNIDNYNIAWYRIPLSVRQSINSRVTQKSIAKAVKDKDMNYAYAVANSERAHYQSGGNDVMQRMYQNTLLKYYQGVKDSSAYIRMAIPFYTQNFMAVKVDSIIKMDSIQRLKLQTNGPLNLSGEMDKALKEAIGSGKLPANATVSKRLISSSSNLSPQCQYYCNSLNEVAWTIYTLSKDINYLNKALIFAKRANEFFESPEAMDTYARLLYKTGNKTEAINWQKKAIATTKLRGTNNNSEFEKVLAKMQADETKIDMY